MRSTRHKKLNHAIIIRLTMHPDKKILYEAVGRVLRQRRKELGYKLTIFAYENDIPTTSLTSIESAKTEACFSNIYKIAKALNMSFEEFGQRLDKELPENFNLQEDN